MVDAPCLDPLFIFSGNERLVGTVHVKKAYVKVSVFSIDGLNGDFFLERVQIVVFEFLGADGLSFGSAFVPDFDD